MVAGCCGACGVQVLDDREVKPMEINFAPETSLPMPEEKSLPSDANMMLDPEALLREEWVGPGGTFRAAN